MFWSFCLTGGGYFYALDCPQATALAAALRRRGAKRRRPLFSSALGCPSTTAL
jgi:hypothetical protein